MMRMQVLRGICPKVPEKSRASHGKAKCPDGEVQETKMKRRSSGENRRFLFGVPEGIRTPDLTLRSSKNLVFNRVPARPVMFEKYWNIKDF